MAPGSAGHTALYIIMLHSTSSSTGRLCAMNSANADAQTSVVLTGQLLAETIADLAILHALRLSWSGYLLQQQAAEGPD